MIKRKHLTGKEMCVYNKNLGLYKIKDESQSKGLFRKIFLSNFMPLSYLCCYQAVLLCFSPCTETTLP